MQRLNLALYETGSIKLALLEILSDILLDIKNCVVHSKTYTNIVRFAFKI